jgi:copper(I)-binding protein
MLNFLMGQVFARPFRHIRPALSVVRPTRHFPRSITMKKLITLMMGLLFAGAFSAAVSAHGFKVGDIEIGHPYSRAMVPGAKVGGGYLKITNNGSTDDRLVGITADRAKTAEIHQMNVNDGVMIMRPVTGGISIPAGQTVEFKPGGYHIMFMDVAQPFRQGEMIKARLTFEKAGAVDVEFSVGKAGGGMSDDMGHMDMSNPQ